MINKYYLEDFPVGFTYETRGATLSESQILDFAFTWDPQPFHIDKIAAEDWGFGGVIASGYQTLLVSFRLIYQENVWSYASLGGAGLDELRWHMPVRPGDTLHVRSEVISSRHSNSKPDRGVAHIRYETYNQNDKLVMSFVAIHILKSRPLEKND